MTEFTQTLRHYCRNPRCRSKLPSPASDPRKAFCTRGCHSSFYLKRCVVCEKPIDQPKRGGRRLVCKKAKCRSAFQDRIGGRGYQASFSTESIQQVPDFIGAKQPLKPERPRYIVAGPKISASAYHCATLPLDPETARRIDAANDWKRIKRETAWGRRWVSATSVASPSPSIESVMVGDAPASISEICTNEEGRK